MPKQQPKSSLKITSKQSPEASLTPVAGIYNGIKKQATSKKISPKIPAWTRA
jgi:hypothetical protein